MNPLDPLRFPLRGLRLIEASAGTGKTYTLAALYLRLVLGHGGACGFDRALMPPEILVVTYTNAATEELRDRIRRRLAEAAAFFRRQGQGDAWLRVLRAEFEASDWPGQAFRLEQAAQWMDEAAVYTIHAWCQRMLRQHAFDSGSLFDLTLQTDNQELLLECACDYWRSFFCNLAAADLAHVLEQINCTTPLDLLECVKPLLNMPPPHGTAQRTADPLPLLQQRQQAIEDARRVWLSDFDTAVTRIQQARQNKTLNNNKYRAASLDGWLRQLHDWVHGAGMLPQTDVLQKLSATGLAEGCAKNNISPQHPAYDAMDQLNARLEAPKIRRAVLYHAAADIHRRWQQARQQRAFVNFDDLLTRLQTALCAPGYEGLAEVVRQQYPVALVDEFQDTDPVQYAIFKRIYREQTDAALIMIGDPKQAIYAFRGADLHTYLTARQHIEPNRYNLPDIYTLATNYRSTAGVVQAVNQLFGAASTYAEGPFLFKDKIPFEAVAAQGRAEQLVLEGRPVSGLTFWQVSQTDPLKLGEETGFRARMANAAASAIVRWLNAAGQKPAGAGFRSATGPLEALKPADLAILVRNVTEARAMREALARRGIRSVYLSDKDSVFASAEAEDVLRLLRACAEPEQDRLLRAALAATVLARPLAELDLLNQDEQVLEDTVEQFRRYRHIWQRQGVLSMLRTLLMDYGAPARLLADPQGERSLTNLLHLSELLQAAAVELDGEQALIRWLSNQRADPSGESDEQVLRLESDAACVKVITIHKSKGLEYPLVLLPFIAAAAGARRPRIPSARFHDADGCLQHVFDPTPEEQEAADRERLAEDLRLLYVALTRARHAVWAGAAVVDTRGNRKKSDPPRLSGLDYLLGRGQPMTVDLLAASLTALAAASPNDIALEPLPEATTDVYIPATAPPQLQPVRHFTHTIPRDWQITSYSGIVAGSRHDQGQAQAQAQGQGQAQVQALGTTGVDSTLAAPDSATEDQLQEAGRVAPAIQPRATRGAGIHAFARGAEAGTFLHGLLEWAAAAPFADVLRRPETLVTHVTRICTLRDWTDWVDPLCDWLVQLLQTPLQLTGDAISLAQLPCETYQPEMEFLLELAQLEIAALDQVVHAAIVPGARRPRLQPGYLNPIRGMLKGFIDLVFEHQGRYYVLDYKSNYLGEDVAAYHHAAMQAAVLEHRYDIQLVLYSLALHRLLKIRLPDYDYDRHVGGAVYLFLRGVQADGHGVYVNTPPRKLIEALDAVTGGGKGS